MNSAAGLTLVTGGGVLEYHAALDAAREDLIGARFGDYRATEVIGEGGMSVVFAGERADGQFNRTVAIKVIGQSSSEDWIHRTSQERQILADLSHPGIAQLFDAGVNDDGYSFIVMEYVAGQSIDRYADQAQCDITGRLELFSQVLAALDHAHQQSIVHGDIKPSNILVSRDGQAKLLDFGIGHFVCSAADEDTKVLRALTPSVASPEQLLGKPMTPSADVYQLGLLLYGLLTRHFPYAGQSYDEARRRATENTLPPPPSEALLYALTPTLRSDLDAIVAKCLASQREQRYANAGELADDIRRVQERRPVSARPVGIVERSRRFVWRNGMVAAIVGIAGITIVLLAVAFLHRSAAQRERVALEAAKAESLSDALTDVIRSLSPYEVGRATPETERALRAARKRVESALEGQEALQPGLLHALAKAELQMGAFDSAEQNLLRAMELGELYLSPSQLAIIQTDYGQLLSVRERWDEADKVFAAAWAQMSSDNSVGSRDKAHLLSGRASIKHGLGDLDGATALLEQAQELVATRPQDSGALLPHINAQLASILNDRNQPARALPLAQRAIEQYTEHYGKDHPALLPTLNVLAVSYGRLGEHRLGEQTARRAIQLLKRDLAGREDVLQQILVNLSVSLYRQRKYQSALEVLDEASAVGRSVAGATGQAQAFIGLSRSNILNRLGRFDDAQEALADAEGVLLTNGHSQSEIMGRIRNSMGFSLARRGRFAEAVLASRSAVDFKSRHSGPQSHASAESRLGLARGLIGTGQIEEATEQLNLAWDLLSRDEADTSLEHPLANVVAGELNIARGDLNAASELFSRALASWQERRKTPHEDIAYGHYRLGELNWRSGDAENAMAHLREAVSQYDAVNEISIDATSARLLLARLMVEKGESASLNKAAMRRLVDQVPQRADWQDHWLVIAG